VTAERCPDCARVALTAEQLAGTERFPFDKFCWRRGGLECRSLRRERFEANQTERIARLEAVVAAADEMRPCVDTFIGWEAADRYDAAREELRELMELKEKP